MVKPYADGLVDLPPTRRDLYCDDPFPVAIAAGMSAPPSPSDT